MFVKISLARLMLCLAVLSCAASAQAQESITPAKRELIKELLEVTGGTKTTEAMINSELDQNEKMLPTLMSQMIGKDIKMTASEREAFERKMNESAARISKRFRELLKTMDFPKLIDEISYSIYDKYYTESELRDLIAFYKSPTGRKTIEVLPQLYAESIARTTEAIMPRMQQIMTAIMDEEKARFESEPPPPSPPPGPKKRRRH
jgi:uncharacterized protein